MFGNTVVVVVRDGKWEVHMGLIEGTAAQILIRTRMDKLATAVIT